MQTPYGEIPDDDAEALEFRLQWYLRYGNLPAAARRESAQAKADYGFQYERFVGHLFEERGYRVQYRGLRMGVEDGGIDLVARAPRKIRLVQCKRWRQNVGMDVISRLQGGVERFRWEERRDKPGVCRTSIRGVLVTSASVEASARALAEHLGLFVLENVKFSPYPAIKGKAFPAGGGRFLLPFDRNYDQTTMELRRGDRFFRSVREALENGFYYPEYHRGILMRLRRKTS